MLASSWRQIKPLTLLQASAAWEGQAKGCPSSITDVHCTDALRATPPPQVQLAGEGLQEVGSRRGGADQQPHGGLKRNKGMAAGEAQREIERQQLINSCHRGCGSDPASLGLSSGLIHSPLGSQCCVATATQHFQWD
ncbi:hypothetical protein MDA_GLEAN10013356 [Myotis davidii]|uniref:Uncharacterized protein n=1 Tax=Myotis davidii TaxID=225400 RepID=L5MAX7_MYODS|nr:hypothetical protein MDA_GLEAN10013356 [Myotis davidii]